MDKQVKEAVDVVRDLSVMLGQDEANRAARRAAKARIRGHIKKAKKKKVATQKSV